jgi:hypothetical protein
MAAWSLKLKRKHGSDMAAQLACRIHSSTHTHTSLCSAKPNFQVPYDSRRELHCCPAGNQPPATHLQGPLPPLLAARCCVRLSCCCPIIRRGLECRAGGVSPLQPAHVPAARQSNAVQQWHVFMRQEPLDMIRDILPQKHVTWMSFWNAGRFTHRRCSMQLRWGSVEAYGLRERPRLTSCCP